MQRNNVYSRSYKLVLVALMIAMTWTCLRTGLLQERSLRQASVAQIAAGSGNIASDQAFGNYIFSVSDFRRP